MKSLILILLAAFCVFSNAQENRNTKPIFVNPIFPGDNPDPSILVDGEDYYVVHSSFEYYPGLLIWHSTDLLNWTPLVNTLHKYVGSVWAPDLVKYDDKYYIYFPASNTNYVIWADQIVGPWSDPIELDITMIDPGHVVDEDGNRFLYFSSGSYVPLSKDGLSIDGEIKHSYSGWEIPREWSIECFCMEGPKLFKRGEYYYLTVAEGGTAGPATGHMVISARSKSPLGPWENSPYNPIIRAKSNADRWWSVGHATPFKDAYDDWWMILHAYEKDYYNMGRQSLLSPIEWTSDNWFKIPEGYTINTPVEKPKGNTGESKFSLSDNFAGKELSPHWKFFKGSETNRYEMEGNDMLIQGKGTSVADCSPMLCIPQHHSYIADVEMEIIGDAVGGLVLFYNEKAFSGILADNENVLANLRGWQFLTEEKVLNGKVYLRLKNVEHTVDMYYSLDGEQWIKIENSFESSAYHHNVLSGFMSLRIGLCSMGTGSVRFKHFNYQPLEQ